jgi:hypothetical protein
LFGGFIAWLALSALAETTNLDTFSGLYWESAASPLLAHI